MDTVKKDKVIKPRNLIKNDVVFKTYKIYNYKYKRTPERVAIVNRCYLPHLLVWWDADMLIYQDGVLHIKEHPEVIIFDEGSYNLITFEYLSVFDTLKQYYGYSDNQVIYMALYFKVFTNVEICGIIRHNNKYEFYRDSGGKLK